MEHENDVWNLFKVSNRVNDVVLVSFWTDFTTCRGVSFVDFKRKVRNLLKVNDNDRDNPLSNVGRIFRKTFIF